MKKVLFYLLMVLAISVSACRKVDPVEEDTKVEYVVTFDTDGGSKVPNQKIEEGKLAIKPTKPTRESYIFASWDNEGVEYDFKTPVTKDIKLVAKWTLDGKGADWVVEQLKGTGGVVIREYKGTKKDKIVIPATIASKKVLSIKGYNEAPDYRGIFNQGLGGDYPPNTTIKSIDLSQAIYLDSILDGAFASCKSLTEIKLPESLKVIGFGAFWESSAFEGIELPEGLQEIGVQAFNKCTSLKSIVIPESLNKIGEGAFYDCSALVTVEFPESGNIKELNSVFYGCTSLESVNLPEGLESIGYGAFYSAALKSISLPKSLKTIGSGVFWSCSDLVEVIINRTDSPLTEVNYSPVEGKADDTFYGTPIKTSSSSKIHYPEGTNYRDEKGWKTYEATWVSF